MADPLAGDVIKGTGGLRKLRWSDSRRSKGKRGGIRVIYDYFLTSLEFWLFTLYDKGEVSDLSAKEPAILETMLRNELKARSSN
jgi:hypothetical protein